VTKYNLTEKQAFDAMLLFLKRYWQLTKNQAAADMWDMGTYGVLDKNGIPATGDPAAWPDWMDCVEQAVVEGYVLEPGDLYGVPEGVDPSNLANPPA